ncbi:MAG TPA: PAS domain S-box protein [Hymenobacter sp.]|jgi:PAS domain S-box-containing protein|uniref:PAS domain-containing sensor histidine kinase n=1 Tax=Hymenobacter sp. TaxID=1898978 RepID=UPI002ED7E3F3
MPASLPPSLFDRARQQLRAQPDDAPGSAPASPADPQPTAEDLQLHKIELEMQQEMLLVAQEEAVAAQARYADLYNFAPTALLTLLADGRIAQLNARACQLLGSTSERLLGRRFLLFVAPETREAFQAFVSTALAESRRHALEVCLQTEASVSFPARVEAEARTNALGQPEVQLAMVDLTQLHREAEKRRRTDARLQQVLSATGTGTWTWHFASNRLEWDAQAQACFGRPHDPTPASFDVLQAAVHSDDVPCVQRAMHAAVHDRQPLDLVHRVIWPDGSVHFVAAHGNVQRDAHDRPECLTGLIRDVTARYEAEAELNYQSNQFQLLLDTLPILFVRLSATGNYLEMKGAARQRLGLDATNSVVGKSIFDLYPILAEPTRRLLAGESFNFVASETVDGQRVSFHNHGFFDQQRQEGVVFAIDVTESEVMKERMRTEQEFTRSLLNHSIDGVAAFDHNGRLTAWNRAMTELTGRTEADALGQDVFACLRFEPHSLPANLVAGLLQRQARPRFNQPVPWPDPAREVELTTIPLTKTDEDTCAGGLLLVRDVTERNRLHAHATQLKARQQREIFRLVLMAQEVERKRIAEALHNGVGQLLYATKLHLEDGATTPGATVALALLEDAIKATREVSFELTPGILEDFGLAVALQKLARSIPPAKLKLHMYLTGLERPLPQVLNVAIYRMVQELLNNVLKHARAEEATLHVAYEDQQVYLSMEDDGGGFDVAETVGTAQGMGLASLYNRAALLGGQFELASRPGRGTIATFTLPVAEE